jgi:hypothetical protein
MLYNFCSQSFMGAKWRWWYTGGVILGFDCILSDINGIISGDCVYREFYENIPKSSTIYKIRYTEATKGSTWTFGITTLEASHFLPTVTFSSSPLCPISTSPKRLLVTKVIDTNISVKRMAGRPRINIYMCANEEREAACRCEWR